MWRLVALFLLSLNSFAGTITFQDPCSKIPLFEHQVDSMAGLTVGHLTVETLEEFSIPYVGAERGMNSIFDTPVGMDALDIISKSEMFAYGWCYSVNGFEPNVYPDETFLEAGDRVLWWYGYAHYKGGEWISQCVPSHLRQLSSLCGNGADKPL